MRMLQMAIFLILMPASALFAQTQSVARAVLSVAGSGTTLRLLLRVPAGYYAYASSEFSIPVTVSLAGKPAPEYRVSIPPGVAKGSDGILKGLVKISVTLLTRLKKRTALKISLRYQLCSEAKQICLPPDTASVTYIYTPPVQRSGGPPERDLTALDKKAPSIRKTVAPAEGGGGEKDWVSNLVRKNIGSPVIAFLLAVLGGFLASLTPCVYPIIPITVGYFSGRGDSGPGRFRAALIYVAGMGLVYTLLGVISGFTGAAFGSFTNTPVFYLVLGSIFILLALSLFEVYEFRLPAFSGRLRAQRGSGYSAAFLMGVVTGLVASPCVGPLIVFLLTGVLQAGKPLLGAVLMAGFSMGMGILFLFLALFSQKGARLPESGNWMVRIKLFLGVLVLGSSFYFLKQAFLIWRLSAELMAVIGFAVLLVVMVAGLYKLRRLYGRAGHHGQWLAFLFLLLLLFFALTWRSSAFLWNDLPVVLTEDRFGSIVEKTASGEERVLLEKGYRRSGNNGYVLQSTLGAKRLYSLRKLLLKHRVDLLGAALDRAAHSGKPLFLDVGAVWCAVCRDLEAGLMKRPGLLAYIRKAFIPFKADLDRSGKYLKRFLKLPGVPTLAVLEVKGKGAERKITVLQEISAFGNLDRFLDGLRVRLQQLLKK